MTEYRLQMTRRLALMAPGAVAFAASAVATSAAASAPLASNQVTFHRQVVGDVDVFYRAAGPVDAPVILLLHGFPTSSHMFRDLIPHLARSYRVIAPDLPGFGQTKAPPRGQFAYTFDNLAKTIDGFTETLGLKRYALYVFDYGAPTGFRLAAAHPERVTAIISQNGNAYVEGLSNGWNPIQAYWADPTPANRAALRGLLTADMTRTQYVAGADEAKVSPDGYTLDVAYLSRPGQDDIQLDLFLDYRSNVALYPAWQAYFRQHRPPILAAWGKNDIFFIPPGAEAYKRDQPQAEVRFFDTGHFALETHSAEIGALIVDFMGRKVKA
jgi:pimeloyl-ACP methyl ester carboxylesterase